MLKRFIELYENNERFVVFDVETVGIKEETTIVEIGAVEAGRAYRDNYNTFNRILKFCPVSWKPYWREMRIHQIPSREIENGEERGAVLKEFIEFIEGATLISHTKYDIYAMYGNLKMHEELKQLIELSIWENFIDSCKLARKICPHLASFSLSNLAKHFRVINPKAHRGLSDAITTKRVLAKLLRYYYRKV